jgi:excisionase family DNA binding protein
LTQDRVTIQEAARIANISRKTLYRWIEKGLISKEKDKNLSYVSLAEVKALCDRGTNQQDTENVTGDNQGTQQDTNRVTVDVTYLEGLMVRLGQYEAERRYLLEYKSGLEARDKELEQTRATLARANSELKRLVEIRADAERKAETLAEREAEVDRLRSENARLRLPWWRRWFLK